MLMPKKVKFRKQQRGRRKGMAKGGSYMAFGDYGLQALECGWVTARLPKGSDFDLATMQGWIAQSWRAVAPKTLVKALDAKA